MNANRITMAPFLFLYQDNEWEVEGKRNPLGIYKLHVARTDTTDGSRIQIVFNEKFEPIGYSTGVGVFDVRIKVNFDQQVREFSEFARRVISLHSASPPIVDSQSTEER